MITLIIAFAISVWFDLSFISCIVVVLVAEFFMKRFLKSPTAPQKLTCVYVVSSGEINEGSSIDAVFSTEQDAEARALELVEKRFNFGKNNKTQRTGNRWKRGVDFIELDKFDLE